MQATSNSTKSTWRESSWFVLMTLTALNILNYVDRNIFSALVPAIKRDLGFSDTELGLLGSAFILSYTLISPVFGYFGDRAKRPRLMAAGLVVWSAATAVTGYMRAFSTQLLARVVVGGGEAAYSVIAPTVIADSFPRQSRARIFAIYSCAIPVGSALGYVLGGLLEPRVGWSHAFFVVGVPGLILAGLLFLIRDPERGKFDPETKTPRQVHANQWSVYRELFRNGGFLSTVLGYAAYTFVVGGLAFWMPTYIVRYFPEVGIEKANLVFGAVTVVGGFFGTVLGGWLADRVENHSGNGYLKISFLSMLLAVPLFWFTLSRPSFSGFSGALFFLDVAIFMCMSPLDAAVITFVNPLTRSTAMALNIFVIHALGDGISRVAMGAISDAHGLKAAVMFLPWMLVLACGIWWWGVWRFFRVMKWPHKEFALPRLQIHRGYRPDRSVVENTVAAFAMAKHEGAVMFECDVRLTVDGEVVVFHDEDMQRIGGDPRRVDSVTADELFRLTQAPRLRDILNNPSLPTWINIELKTAEAIGRSGLEQKVADLVRDAGAMNRVIISSFNPLALRRMANVAPEIPRGLLVTEEEDPKNKIYLRKMWLAWLARPHLLHVDDKMASESRVREWRERGIPVVVWTVNDASRADQLFSWGVASVISDQLTDAKVAHLGHS